MEEVLVSMLHNERVDWLLPGVAETRKVLSFPMVIIGQVDMESPLRLLMSVRIYWDQGMLMKQISCTGDLLFADGMKVLTRLANPTAYNCNLLVPLDEQASDSRPGMNIPIHI